MIEEFFTIPSISNIVPLLWLKGAKHILHLFVEIIELQAIMVIIDTRHHSVASIDWKRRKKASHMNYPWNVIMCIVSSNVNSKILLIKLFELNTFSANSIIQLLFSVLWTQYNAMEKSPLKI